MAVIGITDGSEVTVSEPSRTVNVEELEQVATASYGSSTVKDYEQLANKPSIEGVTLVGDTELSEIGAAAADHTHSLESLGAASVDHTHTLESLGAAAADHSHTLESLGAAAANHSHSLESLGAAAANHTHTPASIGAAEADHTHTPESIGAAAASHTHAASSITGLGSAALMDDDDFDAAGAAAAVLGTAQDDAGDATVYGALASAAAVEDELVHHTHTPAEIGAAPAVHTHTPASIGAAAESHEHDAADITSGVLDDELIPNLDASKITSGTFDGGRLPTVPITKGGTGATDAAAARTALGAAAANHTHTAADVGAADAVHTHGAGEITSGTLASDRLPTVPVSKGGTGATTAAAARTNLEVTPANIGAAAASHTHSASDVASGTLASDRLPTVPVSKGGTHATTVEDARNNLYFGAVQLGGTSGGRQSVTSTMTSNNAAFVLQRGTTKAIMLVDLWTTSPAIFGNLPAEVVLVRGAASGSSGAWTIQNNTGSALVVEALGAKFGEVQDNTAAMTENVTRTQMDAASSHTHSYLPLSGGTLTGAITETGGGYIAKSSNLDDDTTPSSETGGNSIVALVDKDGVYFGSIQPCKFADGSQGIRFQSRRTVNGNGVWHWLDLIVNADGTFKVSVPTNAKAPWRTAIGAAASDHTHNYLPLSGGQMTGPITMKDGTAMPHATGTGWYPIVMSGFGSGGAIKYMNPSELLTNIGGAAASHTHAASDIASGTLPIARGGTGSTSAADARTALGVTAANIGLGNVGDTLENVLEAVSLPSNNNSTILGTLSVPKGVWIIKGIVSFPANSTGDRKVYIGTGTTLANTRNACNSAHAISTTQVVEEVSIATLTSTKTYNLIAYQNSGGALNVSGMITAVRIK